MHMMLLLASLIDRHHVPHHNMIDNSFTYDYAVSKCRYRAKRKKICSLVVHCWKTYMASKKCIIRTFIHSLED